MMARNIVAMLTLEMMLKMMNLHTLQKMLLCSWLMVLMNHGKFLLGTSLSMVSNLIKL